MAAQIPARLGFVVVTNHDTPLINTALFRSSSGDTVVVDRDTTEWNAEEIDGGLYRMEMIWRRCYIWENGAENYIPWQYPHEHELEFLEFELEDDAPAGYFVRAEICGWFDWGFVSPEIEGN